ncbi:HAD-IA family hydrolase [Agromyces seonyuensis]|uniref:HAD-IA family hydrolase n=1 Tax=Agromyces seonyuensis TaxID=2662446 RepID=UPI0019245360
MTSTASTGFAPAATRLPAPQDGPADPDRDHGLALRPDALLLDFGGVVFETTKRPDGIARFAERVRTELARGGFERTHAELVEVISGGQRALKDWKNSESRRLSPTELDPRTIVTEYLFSPLPAAERELLAGSAGTLLAELTSTVSDHRVRPGIPELLALARELGVKVGIVSNAHSGRSHRTLIAANGLAAAFDVQAYSDEVGLRKPHPGFIEFTARALGTTAARCWYVGDTLDRDVVAGRRSGVGAVVLIRHHRTDTPPYPVAETADAVFDTPEGLIPLLRDARPRPQAAPTDATPSKPLTPSEPTAPWTATRPSALLLDHGGVLVVSRPDEDARRAFAADLAAGLRRAGYAVSDAAAAAAVADGRARQKAWKNRPDADDREVDPGMFWVDFVGPSLEHAGAGVREWLRAESWALMLGYARSKSRAELRSGVRGLLELAHAEGIPVAVVSNTVCGRAVREELAGFGIEHLVGAHVYSDELGWRKPSPRPVEAALTALDADPATAWFVGDKPHRDVAAARSASVGTSVLVRGGAFRGEPADGPAPDLVVDEVDHLLDLLRTTLHPTSESE